jgi:hypothetical protein
MTADNYAPRLTHPVPPQTTGNITRLAASSTPQRILGPNPSRRGVSITNEGAEDVYYGYDGNGLDATTGQLLSSLQSQSTDHNGDIWIYAASGSPNVVVNETAH